MIYMQNDIFTESYFLHIKNDYYRRRSPLYPTYLIRNDFPKVYWLNPEIKDLPTKAVRWPCRWLNSTGQRKLPINYKIVKMTHEKYIPQLEEQQVFSVDYIQAYQENVPTCYVMDFLYQPLGFIVCPWICYADNQSVKQFKIKQPVTFEMFEKAMKNHSKYYKKELFFQ